MAFIEGDDRNQLILISECLEDYVSADNPVRFIDAFVESLDLIKLGFEHATNERKGRPPYHPGVLLKLYLYGYLNRIRTSRDLEKQTYRNLEVIWLVQRLHPDFKTIADFRKNNLQALSGVYGQFTEFCRGVGLYGGELVAVDGSKFKAVNARDRNYNERILKEKIARTESKIQEYLRQLDENDKLDSDPPKFTAEEIKEKIEELKKKRKDKEKIAEDLKKSGDTQISTTDPDSKALRLGKAVSIGYNVQFAVDHKHKLIAAFEVTNSRADTCELSKIATKAKETLQVESLKVVADTGYFNTQELKACEDSGIQPYVPKPDRTKQRPHHFDQSKFVYEAQKDIYVCPAGESLQYHFTRQLKPQLAPVKYYATSACKTCRIKAFCTPAKNGRRIVRLVDQDIVDRTVQRTLVDPQKIRARSAIIEHVFGTLKCVMNYGHFLLKGFKKVTAEMSLTALAYNMKRAINILGTNKLIAALP